MKQASRAGAARSLPPKSRDRLPLLRKYSESADIAQGGNGGVHVRGNPLLIVLTPPAEAKLVKSAMMLPNEKLTAENLPAARACAGKKRICANGRPAALLLPTCELVCPEDGRKDVSCYRGLMEESDESRITWVEVPEIPEKPLIYSEGSYSPGSDEPAADCEVLELVRASAFPAGAFYGKNHRKSRKVKTAR